jgi:Holliday junction resolvase RusA-like endonuclease
LKIDPSVLSIKDALAFSAARDAAKLAGNPMPTVEEYLNNAARRSIAPVDKTLPHSKRDQVSAALRVATSSQEADAICPPVVTLRRMGDCIAGSVLLAPRTKKNSTELGIRQSPAYRAYRGAALPAIRDAVSQIGSLQADVRYNVCAHFYPDSSGNRADANNFYASLADLLENAGLIPNDRQFCRWWGSDVFVDHGTTPRTEFVITPIEMVTVTVSPSMWRLLSRGCTA